MLSDLTPPDTSPGQYSVLYQTLGYVFKDPALLQEALTHPSLEGSRHYQRLEFVGDRVLGLVIAQWLYDDLPSLDEGGLASRHTNMVRRRTLARAATKMQLTDFILMAKSTEDQGGKENDSILADVCEAIIGAVHQDGGYRAAQRLIRKFWKDYITDDLVAERDAKTRLQEWLQARQMPVPDYHVTAREGPAHAPSFTITAQVPDMPPESGTGSTKRSAEQKAAHALLERLKNTAADAPSYARKKNRGPKK